MRTSAKTIRLNIQTQLKVNEHTNGFALHEHKIRIQCRKAKKKNREENIHQERKVINALLIATDNN